MKHRGFPILIAATIAAGCSPSYKSGKTQCSDKNECPSGYICSDDGISGTYHCVDDKCPAGSTFYCSQSDTCWAKPGACSTVTYCGTTKYPGYVICAVAGYHPDCNSDSCLPNGAVADASPGSGGRDGGMPMGTGGAIGKGGAGGTTVITGYGGTLGTGGMRDAGPEAPGVGGYYLTGGTGRGGTFGTGGLYLTGGTLGRGGTTGSGGSGGTGTSLCSGTPYSCDYWSIAGGCTAENGCVWDAATESCSGTPLSCSTYASGTWCYFSGCTWSGPLSCNPSVMTPYCSSLYDPLSDTACWACAVTACCAQVTDCLNDTACSLDSSGAAWRAYIDCMVGCCGSTCSLY